MFNTKGESSSNHNARAPRREVYIRWLSPPLDWVALNTDGFAKGSPGSVGGGSVLRDSRGAFIKGMAASLGVCTSYKAELLAAVMGLEMAVNMGIQKLEL